MSSMTRLRLSLSQQPRSKLADTKACDDADIDQGKPSRKQVRAKSTPHKHNPYLHLEKRRLSQCLNQDSLVNLRRPVSNVNDCLGKGGERDQEPSSKSPERQTLSCLLDQALDVAGENSPTEEETESGMEATHENAISEATSEPTAPELNLTKDEIIRAFGKDGATNIRTLIAFKVQNGDYNIPSNGPYKKLRAWLLDMQQRAKCKDLSEQQLEIFEFLNVEWTFEDST